MFDECIHVLLAVKEADHKGIIKHEALVKFPMNFSWRGLLMKMLSSFGPVWNVPANCTDIESQQDVHFWRIFHHVHRSMVDFKEKKGTEKVAEGRDVSATKEMDYLENPQTKRTKKKNKNKNISFLVFPLQIS